MKSIDIAAQELRQEGAAFASHQALLARPANTAQFRLQVSDTAGSSFALARYADEQARLTSGSVSVAPGIRRLQDNTRLLRGAGLEIHGAARNLCKLPFARSVTGQEMPRIAGVAQGLLNAAKFRWSLEGLRTFIEGFQAEEPLTLRELWALPVALKLVLLDEILNQAPGAFSNLPESDKAVDAALLCLQEMSLPVWATVLEPLVPFENILRADPAGAYPAMDFDSRDMYRTAVRRIAEHSDKSEVEVAGIALAMAEEAHRHPGKNERIYARRSHIGYYLVDAGLKDLRIRCEFRPRMIDRIRSMFRADPDDFYLGGIQTITICAIAAIVLPLVPHYNPFGSLFIAFLLLLLPVSQGAVELLNHTVTALLKPQALPKLDFSAGVPDDCRTLVAVPTLLLNERQVRGLVEDLEVRCLANQDPSIHYALLTDLPDSVEKPEGRDSNPLVILAGELIDDLNRRYAGPRCGRFLMLHRHRIFNPRQGVWMGWERKRGKLLDLNRLIMGGMDCFPFKAGDASVLAGIRYVLTLDSDTKLPRDSVARMVGAIAHPLNRAVLDPRLRIVTEGYGLMQPRVGITVHSAARSRLAAVYSGQTGFDIYTRAVSDVYQDLYGEGIFTGKGLYEVQILHEVLDRRFPQNSLLSHDLIEGAYARVGLLTDVEVMDDYPSHYSAQNRRKHRWVRGDWQILRWLLGRVPDDSGHMVGNPTSIVSRWKIFDNLRRSLVEPATFVLLVAGWLWLPGTARYWTLATFLVIFVPVFVQFAFSLARALGAEQRGVYIRESIRDSFNLLFSTALTFAFLAHQTLLMLDAIVRSLIRSFVTGDRLLEWETAAEAEIGGGKQTPVEITMRLVPLLSLSIALLVTLVRPTALPWALPILILWAAVGPITRWVNRPPHDMEVRLSANDLDLLRKIAWRTWQYFAQFAAERNHGLVPDNVQEEVDAGGYREAQRISPTNAGLQLNARQAALALGYLTLPEFVEQTLANLRTLDTMRNWHGHLLNWYSTVTLEPMRPFIASTADSGNFLASLCSLRMGTIEAMQAPMLTPALKDGLLDALADAPEDWKPDAAIDKQIKLALQPGDAAANDGGAWPLALLSLDLPPHADPAPPWTQRAEAIASMVTRYLPWLHPKFSALRALPELGAASDGPDGPIAPLSSFTPRSALAYCDTLQDALAQLQAQSPDAAALAADLASATASAHASLRDLLGQMEQIASIAQRILLETDYKPLLDPTRRLLSIGYDTERDERLNSCYDLLASESRTAIFLAIAKGDVLQETWFRVARKTALIDGQPVLMSWSGTMFEYLMPTLWMQTLPETLLAQSLPAAVRIQRNYSAHRHVPWGISEACDSRVDAAGNYQYHAFGVPALALNPPPEGSLVIAPYATVLALEIDAASALANLRSMEKLGWLGEFGWYESADYSSTAKHAAGQRYTLVRSWMAHHQGMSLLAIANLLADRPFQRWFHSDPRVRATELLLQEKPAHAIPAQELPRSSKARFSPGAVPRPAKIRKSM